MFGGGGGGCLMACIAFLAHCFGSSFKVWWWQTNLMKVLSRFAYHFIFLRYFSFICIFVLFPSPLPPPHPHSLPRSRSSNACRGGKEGIHLCEEGAELNEGVFPPRRHSPPTTPTVWGSEVPVVHYGPESCGETPP